MFINQSHYPNNELIKMFTIQIPLVVTQANYRAEKIHNTSLVYLHLIQRVGKLLYSFCSSSKRRSREKRYISCLEKCSSYEITSFFLFIYITHIYIYISRVGRIMGDPPVSFISHSHMIGPPYYSFMVQELTRFIRKWIV